MDLTTHDPEGRPWDFGNLAQQRRALERISQTRPLLVVGSPMCGMFSQIMKLNRLRMDPIEYDRRRQEAIRHIEFAINVYELQISSGRYFDHEQP